MPQSPDCQWVLPVGQGASGRHLGLDTLVSVSMGAKAARDRTSTWQTDTNCTRSSLCWGPNHITPNHYAFHATSSVTKWHEVAKLISTQIALLCGLSLKQAVELKRCRCLGRNCEIRRWRCFREDLPQTTYLLTHFNVLQHRGNNFFLDLRNNYVWQLLVGKTAATPAPTTKTRQITKLMPRSLSRWKAGTCRSSVNFRSTKTQY